MQSYLKWPGGKRRLAARILALAGPGRRLVEPFAGSCAVFLESGFNRGLLADADADLIGAHVAVQQDVEAVIREAQRVFSEANTVEAYQERRREFNARTAPAVRQAALLIYLNRHGFNGLHRRNGAGEWNVSFGKFKTAPQVPEASLRAFAARVKGAVFRHQGFEETFLSTEAGDVVYCDPPYLALSKTASFAAYSARFGLAEHERLTELCTAAAERGIRVVLSNHETPEVRALYGAAGALVHGLDVHRSIAARRESRGAVREVLAVFEPSLPLACAA